MTKLTTEEIKTVRDICINYGLEDVVCLYDKVLAGKSDKKLTKNNCNGLILALKNENFTLDLKTSNKILSTSTADVFTIVRC